jgi:hypothetical protein
MDTVKRQILALQESQTIAIYAISVPCVDLRESVRFSTLRQVQQLRIRKRLNAHLPWGHSDCGCPPLLPPPSLGTIRGQKVAVQELHKGIYRLTLGISVHDLPLGKSALLLSYARRAYAPGKPNDPAWRFEERQPLQKD